MGVTSDDFGKWTGAIVHLRAEEGDLDFLTDLYGEPDVDTEHLANLYMYAQEWATAANLLKKLIGETLGDRLDGRSVEAAGHLLWRGVSKKEVCIDTPGFMAWLEKEATTNPSIVTRLFNVNYCRKGALDPAVRDTFFEKQETGTVEVQVVPTQVLEAAKQKKERAS